MTGRRLTFLYMGFGLYWAWVYLSFNSLPIVGSLSDGVPVIPLLHVISGFVGVVVFVAVVVLRHRIEKSSHLDSACWVAAFITTLGTLLYTLPVKEVSLQVVLTGGIVSGAASPIVILAWGIAYCSLDARAVAATTAGSFALAGVMYLIVSLLPNPISGITVALLPIVSVGLLQACFNSMPSISVVLNQKMQSSNHEVRDFLFHTGNGRVMLGLVLTMFVCGGMRIYIMNQKQSVYEEPLLMALPIIVVALAFLIYAATVSRNSLNLGREYRALMPLVALAVVIAALSGEYSETSFVLVSAGCAVIDLLTWILVIEIVRSTRFAALLVLAAGRMAIHFGMALGETCALAFPSAITWFLIVSILILTFTAGHMFLDRDTTFLFEPPTPGELPGLASISSSTPNIKEDSERKSIREEENQADSLGKRINVVAKTYGLSPRETEVLMLWATGHGSRAIEEKLVVSAGTVKTHLRHIYEKCDVHSRADILDLLDRTSDSNHNPR